MSNKNINKLLAFTAIAGAAIAAGIAYFKHKNSESFDDDFDDFDDDYESEDFDFPLPTEDKPAIKREYVSINLDSDTTKTEESPAVAAAAETKSDVISNTSDLSSASSENIIA